MGARTIHPFPARMAPEIAIDHLHGTASQKHPPLSVLDPMCGSGTVLAAATEKGHKAHGFDVDPLAVLMSTVATQNVDAASVNDEAERIIRDASASSVDTPPWSDAETIRFAEYWFGKTQRVQLSRLSRCLRTVDNYRLRCLLEVALSRIIVTKSPRASLAADTSHSRPHRVLQDSDYDVLRGFRTSVSSLIKILEKRSMLSEASVALGDARSLDIADHSVDLVITSPPYLNAIDYLRGHKMSLIWLGYTIPQLRTIRSGSIGSERALGKRPDDHVEEMLRAIKSQVTDASALPISIITRYAQDLIMFADELARVVRPGAKIVTVVGNSSIRGNYIQNDLLVQQAYSNAGLKCSGRTERQLPEDRRYLPTRLTDQKSALGKRMRAEVILINEPAGTQHGELGIS